MLRYTDITGMQVDKVQTAIDRLRAFEPEGGYYVAFSGGKDSQCIYHLCKRTGCDGLVAGQEQDRAPDRRAD